MEGKHRCEKYFVNKYDTGSTQSEEVKHASSAFAYLISLSLPQYIKISQSFGNLWRAVNQPT